MSRDGRSASCAKQKGTAAGRCARGRGDQEILADLARRTFVLVALVVFVAPVALRAPAAFIFIPPAMVGRPAMLASLAKLRALVLSLAAAIAVAFNGFMEFMVVLGNALLALVLIGTKVGRGEEHESRKRGARQQRLRERVLC